MRYLVLTVKVGDVTKDIKVTVGADSNAYMNSEPKTLTY